MSDLRKEVNTMVDTIRALQEELQKKCQEIIVKEFKTLFDKFPRLTSISWRQGEEWNDEEDVFRVNTEYFKMSFDENDSTDDGFYDNRIYKGKNGDVEKEFDQELHDMYVQVREVLEAIDKDIYEKVFGRNLIEVVVTKQGIEIKERRY